MKENLNILCALLLFFLNIKLSISYFGEQITPNIDDGDYENWSSRETTKLSTEKDMGQCTCDLTNRCDLRCCCDKDCSEEIIKDWEDKDICIKTKKDFLFEDYFCKSRNDSYNYNKNKAGITVNDHIFNLMCIYFDNTKDMGEFYLDEDYKDEVQTLKADWKKDFLNQDEVIEENLNKTLTYGKRIKFDLYKSDSNGNCMKINYIEFLKPFESSCIIKNFNEENITIEKNNIHRYGNNPEISEVTYIFSYTVNENSYTINKIEANLLKTDKKSNSIKFSVLWKNAGTQKNLPNGYLQGKPIKIAIKDDDSSNFYYYKNGYFFGISNSKGECIDNNDESTNLETILFKINNIYTCNYTDSPTTKTIFTEFCNKTLKIGKSLSSSLNNNETWISLYNSTCNKDIKNKDITIYLTFLTSKEGKENSPYEVIQYAKLDLKNSTNNLKGGGIISLIVKFVEFSYSSIENSKKGKITSLIPLPDELLKVLLKNSNKILNINLILLIFIIFLELN